MNKELCVQRLGADRTKMVIRLRDTRALEVMALARQNGVRTKFLAISGEKHYPDDGKDGFKVPRHQVIIKMEEDSEGDLKKTWSTYLSARFN